VPELLRAPSADVRTRTVIGRHLGWLAEHQGRRFDDDDALHRWSVTDLDGFCTSIRDFFGVREHTPADRVLGRWEMPDAESFTGATLNYAEHALRRADGAPTTWPRPPTRRPATRSG
jgi:acetoacetyl-CoA synthetase